MKIFHGKTFLILFTLVIAANLYWFVQGPSPLLTESPLRLVLGSLMIFLLPGLIWGEVLGFRSGHPLETVAVSLALTLTMEVVFLPVPFLFGAGIRLWVLMLFLVCIIGLILLLVKLRGGKEPDFLGPFTGVVKEPAPLNLSAPLLLAAIFILSYATYRWGESLTDIVGEKLVHMAFTRFYYTMPLSLEGLGLVKGATPPNLVHFWEFLIAGWSSLINTDPLFVFYRARFVIPLLGFSGMYLLIKNIYQDKVKAEFILWVVLIMAVGGLMLTRSLKVINSGDPTRGVMLFMGTAHHADSAMDILIALPSALLLMAAMRPGWRNILLFSGVLAATFMWHAREFFQTAIYAGVLGIVFLISRGADKKTLLKRGGMLLAVFIVVAVFFIGIYSTLKPTKETGYSESEIKKLALKYAFMPENLFGVRPPLKFPMQMTIYKEGEAGTLLTREELRPYIKGRWTFLGWLALSLALLPVLALWGDRPDRRLSLFYALLWFLTLSWSFSMLILIVLTYSEIHMTTPRMIYIFSYIVIAAGLWGLFVRFLKPRVSAGRFFFAAVAAVLIVFYPVSRKGFNGTVFRTFGYERASIEWFGEGNPFEFSPELIGFLRSLPPQRVFLSDLARDSLVSVYAPHYHAVQPLTIGSIVHDFQAQKDFRDGKHPLFGTGPVVRDAVNGWLDRYGVDYVLVEKRYYSELLPYFRGFPGDYEIVFENKKKGEGVVRYKGGT